MPEKCPAWFSAEGHDGKEMTFDCDRPAGLHIVHRDAGGVRAVRVPGGAWVRTPKPKR